MTTPLSPTDRMLMEKADEYLRLAREGNRSAMREQLCTALYRTLKDSEKHINGQLARDIALAGELAETIGAPTVLKSIPVEGTNIVSYGVNRRIRTTSGEEQLWRIVLYLEDGALKFGWIAQQG